MCYTKLRRWSLLLAALSFASPAVFAADSDGDGIADSVELAIGLNPDVSEIGQVFYLTPSGDYNRDRISVATDSAGNYHLVYLRTQVDRSPPLSTVKELVYLMVSASGDVLIDETVVNPGLTAVARIYNTAIAVDAAGKVVIAWNTGETRLRAIRLDPSLAPQDGSAAVLGDITDLPVVVLNFTSFRHMDMAILENGDYLFAGTRGGRFLRTAPDGTPVALADLSTNPRSTDFDWEDHGHGDDHGFLLNGYYFWAALYCGSVDSQTEDCVPAFAAIDPDTFQYVIQPTPLQVAGFRKAHGSKMSIGHDAEGNLYFTWIDKRGTSEYEDQNPGYSGGTTWYLKVPAEDLKFDGTPAALPATERALTGRGYPMSFTDASGATHVSYWDAQGMGYQRVNAAGEASDIVTFSDTAGRPNGERKRRNIAMSGSTLFYGDFDPAVTDITGEFFGIRLVMRTLGSSTVPSAVVTSSGGLVSHFEKVPVTAMPGLDSAPELGDQNYRLVITGLRPGESVTVTIDTGSPLPDDWRLQKFNGSRWIELGGTATSNSAFAFEITDGGIGDADGEANGMIVDPVALVLPDEYSEPVTLSGGGGGCTLGGEGTMDPIFPMMLLLAAAWLSRRKLKTLFFVAMACATLAMPAHAGDQDGDGIADEIELAVGLDPAVSNSGTTQLTAMGDANRFRPNVARDAEGNFHIAMIRYDRNASGIWEGDWHHLVYMMVSPAGQVLIDETVVDADWWAKSANVHIDAQGRVNIVWVANNYNLRFTRLDPAADDQDGDTADMANAEFALVANTLVNNTVSWRIVHSHLAANGDVIAIGIRSLMMMRFAVDEAGVSTPDYGPIIAALAFVNRDGHTLNQVAFDANDNAHLLFTDGGSGALSTNNEPMAYAQLSGEDGSVLTLNTPLVTGYTSAPHGVFGNLSLGSDGLLYAVWGDKRGTADEFSYCDFCSRRGTAWFARLDPAKMPVDGTRADMTVAKQGNDVEIATRWYLGAYLDDDNNTHVFFNEQNSLDHMMLDAEGNRVSAVTSLSNASRDANYREKASGSYHLAGDTVFYIGSDPTIQGAGKALFMRKLSQASTAPTGETAQVSGGMIGFLEVVADAELPDADELPADVATTGMNYRVVITGVDTGGATSITIDTGAALPADMRVFKHNGSSWEEFQAVAVSETAFRITVVDGGAGDADGVANGMVVDPVAVTTPVAANIKGSGGGCTIGSANGNAPFDPMFPLMLLFGSFYLLRRHFGGRNLRAMVLAVASSLLALPAAQAEEEDYLADSKTFFLSNTYVGVMLGAAGSDATAGDLYGLPSVVSINNLKIDDGGTGYRLFFGKQLHSHVAVEVGFADLGDIEITADVDASDTDTFLQQLAATAPVAPAGFTIDAVSAWRLADFGATGQWANDLSVHGRLGLFIWETEVQYGPYQQSDDGNDLHLGIGASYAINDQFDVRFEYERFMSTTQMDLIGLGVSYRF